MCSTAPVTAFTACQRYGPWDPLAPANKKIVLQQSWASRNAGCLGLPGSVGSLDRLVCMCNYVQNSLYFAHFRALHLSHEQEDKPSFVPDTHGVC